MLYQPAIRSLKVLAPAKLNLFLRVVGRRPDGFHDLETVMTTINLCDTLVFAENDSTDISLRVVMAPTIAALYPSTESIPADMNNLVLRAAHLLREYAGATVGAQITLIKQIPSAAGMGGGSSDAAATLSGLNRLWNLHLTRAELIELAARLGSDIGFFLGGASMALCRGRGELVEPLAVPSCLHFVVARPLTGLSTPEVFKHCRPDDKQRNVGEFIQALDQPGQCRMVRLLLNDLQAPAESLNSAVRELRRQFNALPVLGHQMSGSGTSYFGICASSRHARLVAGRLKATGVPWVHVARSCI